MIQTVSKSQGVKNQQHYQCDKQDCGLTFKYESHYLRHIQTHNKTKPFQCDQCNKSFKRQDALVVHLRSHSNSLIYACEVENCKEKFSSKASLRYHVLKHKNQPVFTCDFEQCNKSFLTQAQLKQHQRTKKHKQQENYNNFLITKFQSSEDFLEVDQQNQEESDSKNSNLLFKPFIHELADLCIPFEKGVDHDLKSKFYSINQMEKSDQLTQGWENKNENQIYQQENCLDDFIQPCADNFQENCGINSKSNFFKNENGEVDQKTQILKGSDIFEFDEYTHRIVEGLYHKQFQYNDIIDEADTHYGQFKQELQTILGLVDKINQEQDENAEKIRTALGIINMRKCEDKNNFMYDNQESFLQNSQQMVTNEEQINFGSKSQDDEQKIDIFDQEANFDNNCDFFNDLEIDYINKDRDIKKNSSDICNLLNNYSLDKGQENFCENQNSNKRPYSQINNDSFTKDIDLNNEAQVYQLNKKIYTTIGDKKFSIFGSPVIEPQHFDLLDIPQLSNSDDSLLFQTMNL